MKPKSIFATILVSILAASCLYALTMRLVSRLYAHAAFDRLEDKSYEAAASLFQKALSTGTSDPEFLKGLGRARYRMSVGRPLDQAFDLTLKAKEAYLAARDLNPVDAEIVHEIARAEARLEQMFAFSDTTPYDAVAYFEEAIRLRPNAILCRCELARLLHRKHDGDSLAKVVEELAFLYPPVCPDLKNEAFWSPEIRHAAAKGLERAIEEGHLVENAHAAMVSLMLEEQDLAAAVRHYEKYLEISRRSGRVVDYLEFGAFCVKYGPVQDAKVFFAKAIELSGDRGRTLKEICGIYRKGRLLSEFDRFYVEVSKNFRFPRDMEIMRARVLIELERLDDAKTVLEALNGRRPTGEAYFELYRIAEKQKDIGAMLISMHKATIHDRANPQYHLQFSQLLAKQDDLEKAEREAKLALDFSRKPTPGMYEHRANIRWRRQDYSGAASDFLAAARLVPPGTRYRFQAANAYEQAGDLKNALKNYRMAAESEPGNQKYRERLHAMGGRSLQKVENHGRFTPE